MRHQLFGFIMPTWIFTITDVESELKKRVNAKEWPIFKRTRNRTDLSKGDKIVIYHGGRFGTASLVGTFAISSKLKSTGYDTFVVGMSDIQMWKNQVKVKDILDDLKFVKRKDNWGIYFQGGVTRLPEYDYKTILAKTSD